MQIKRTFKPKSLRYGQTEIIDEAKMREIASQTNIAFHKEGECGTKLCFYCVELTIRRIAAGAEVETFFSKFQLA